MPDDLTELPMQELIRLGRDTHAQHGKAEAEAEAARRAVGRVIAEMRRRGETFVQIGEALGMDDSTAHRWARPFL